MKTSFQLIFAGLFMISLGVSTQAFAKKQGHPLMGHWRAEKMEKAGQAQPIPSDIAIDMKFNTDKTFEISMTVKGQTKSKKGKYRIDGKKVITSVEGKDATMGFQFIGKYLKLTKSDRDEHMVLKRIGK